MNVTAQHERRAWQRHSANQRVQVECRKGEAGSAPNIAAAVLEVSQAGLRLALTAPVEEGDCLRLSLQIAGEPMPVRVLGIVRWSSAGVAGIELERRLRKTDLAFLL